MQIPRGFWFRSCTVLCLLTLLPVSGWAEEPATSFGQLQSRFKAGDKVQVFDRRGDETAGSFVNMSATALELMINGSVRSFPETGVEKVTRLQHVSLVKGALLGGITGIVVLGAICGARNKNNPDHCDGNIGVITAINGGIGAASGMTLAALIKRPHTVYERPRPFKVELAPMFKLDQKAAGLMVSLSWRQ